MTKDNHLRFLLLAIGCCAGMPHVSHAQTVERAFQDLFRAIQNELQRQEQSAPDSPAASATPAGKQEQTEPDARASTTEPGTAASRHPITASMWRNMDILEQRVHSIPVEPASGSKARALYKHLFDQQSSVEMKLSDAPSDARKEVYARYYQLTYMAFRKALEASSAEIAAFDSFADTKGNDLAMQLHWFKSQLLDPAWEPQMQQLQAQFEAKRKAFFARREQREVNERDAAQRARNERTAQLPTLVQKRSGKIASLGLSRSFLKSTLRIDLFGIGAFSGYRTFEEWTALTLENPRVEDIGPASLDGGRTKGVRIKLRGRPSTMLFFSHEGNDVFVTHYGDTQRVYRPTSRGDISHIHQFMLEMAQDWPLDR